MLTVHEVADRLQCSWRHVLRMADRGTMPFGVKLGALRRWRADEIEAWTAAGCPAVRKAVS
jgi:excisionase family DNA binding protein